LHIDTSITACFIHDDRYAVQNSNDLVAEMQIRDGTIYGNACKCRSEASDGRPFGATHLT